MQAAMPASSISPYMWIVSGPSSSVPDDGDGMEARKVTAGILPRLSDGARLEQDLERQLGCAAVAKQVDRVVEIDVGASREQRRRRRLVARTLELFGTPALDSLQLRLLVVSSAAAIIGSSGRCTRYFVQ